MNDLLRPALYGAFHRVEPVEPRDGPLEPADVVGPVCESGDFLAKDRPLPPVRAGDLIAVRSAGAYGFVMASNYNARPRAPEVLVDGSEARGAALAACLRTGGIALAGLVVWLFHSRRDLA